MQYSSTYASDICALGFLCAPRRHRHRRRRSSSLAARNELRNLTTMKLFAAVAAVLSLASVASAAKPDLPKDASLRIGVKHRVPEEQCTRKSRHGDKLSMHYTGTLLKDDSQFDSSVGRGPFDFVIGVRSFRVGCCCFCVRATMPQYLAPSLPIPSSPPYFSMLFPGCKPRLRPRRRRPPSKHTLWYRAAHVYMWSARS